MRGLAVRRLDDRSRTVRLIRQLQAHRLRPRRVARRQVRPLQPDAIRLAYFQAIMRTFLEPARKLVEEFILPELTRVLAQRGDSVYHRDAKSINSTMDKITQRFYQQTLRPTQLESLAEQFAQRTSDFQRAQQDRQVKSALGVDVFHAEPNLAPARDAFVAANVALIKTVPQQYFADVEKVVTQGVSDGKRHEQIAEELTRRFGVAESRAKLIARDQVGKFYGQLASERQQELGVTHFIWQTANDNRVRDEHEVLQGQRFAWDAPPAEEGIPGQAINCRCYAEPDVNDLLTESDADREGASVNEDPEEEDAPPEEDIPAEVAPEVEIDPSVLEAFSSLGEQGALTPVKVAPTNLVRDPFAGAGSAVGAGASPGLAASIVKVPAEPKPLDLGVLSAKNLEEARKLLGIESHVTAEIAPISGALESGVYLPGDRQREPHPTQYIVAVAGPKGRIGRGVSHQFKELSEAREFAAMQEHRTVIIKPGNAALPAKAPAVAAPALTLAAPSQLATRLVKAGGTATAAEVAAVHAEVARMHLVILKTLEDNGIHVVAGRGSVTDIMPELAAIQPRGWTAGSLWANVPGLYDLDSKRVVVAGDRLDWASGGHGSADLVIHESGHALDHASKLSMNTTTEGSASSDFIKARTADFASLTTYEKQEGDAGPSETYAESLARYYGTPHVSETQFPHLHAYWKAKHEEWDKTKP